MVDVAVGARMLYVALNSSSIIATAHTFAHDW